MDMVFARSPQHLPEFERLILVVFVRRVKRVAAQDQWLIYDEQVCALVSCQFGEGRDVPQANGCGHARLPKQMNICSPDQIDVLSDHLAHDRRVLITRWRAPCDLAFPPRPCPRRQVCSAATCLSHEYV